MRAAKLPAAWARPRPSTPSRGWSRAPSGLPSRSDPRSHHWPRSRSDPQYGQRPALTRSLAGRRRMTPTALEEPIRNAQCLPVMVPVEASNVPTPSPAPQQTPQRQPQPSKRYPPEPACESNSFVASRVDWGGRNPQGTDVLRSTRLHLSVGHHQRGGGVRDARSIVEALHVRRRVDERSPHIVDLTNHSHSLPQLQWPPEAHLQPARHAGVARVPRCPAHRPVETQGGNAPVPPSRPT